MTGETRMILVVEDEWLLAHMVVGALREAGFAAVQSCGRVGEALRLIEQDAIGFAFLDINLHGEKSYAIADRLGQLAVPYVLMTGYMPDDLPQRLRSATILEKPVAVNEIVTVARRMMPPA